MGDRPTRALWGVGAKIAARLATLGIETVTQLATSDVNALVAEFGPTMGPWFHRMGRGVDTSPVDATPWVARAHGREETYQRDLEWAEVPDAVRTLAARVVEDIDAEGRPAMRVHLKIRYRNFFTLTRSRKLPEPSNDLRSWETRPSRCWTRSSRTSPSGCSAYGWRWCRRRVGTEGPRAVAVSSR